VGRRKLFLGRQNLCCYNIIVEFGSPNCVIFYFVGRQLPNVEKHCFQLSKIIFSIPKRKRPVGKKQSTFSQPFNLLLSDAVLLNMMNDALSAIRCKTKKPFCCCYCCCKDTSFRGFIVVLSSSDDIS
jgi:hypothetical protein